MINFRELREILLSKDLMRQRDIEWISSEPARFLDNTIDMTVNKVALTSYPRSGNTLLKNFLE